MVSRKEVAQLKDGREMDILVAEQVMGWQKETDESELKRLDKYFSHREGRIWWRKPEGGWYYEPSAFSSDLTAAWQVVERMNSRGLTLFLFQSLEGIHVAFDESRAVDPDYIIKKSVARAICEAALLVANTSG
ncbi:MAG: hypothetical protein AB1631_22855 [Acidobacteriota bacterium]